MGQKIVNPMDTHIRPYKFCTPSEWFTRRVRIEVIGIGGTGSEVLSSLARIDYAIRELGHPGLYVRAWDGDRVERPNIGRQAFYPADLGHNKALVSVQRINYLFGLDWNAEPRMFDINRDGNAGQRDLLITCVDVAQFRADLAKSFADDPQRVLWLDAGNGLHSGQVILGWLGQAKDGAVALPSVFDFYPELDGMADDNLPSCSMEEALANQDLPVNRAIANVVMQLVWSLLRHGGLNHHGAYVDIRKGVMTPINILR
ncbi:MULTISPECIES: PRTRC system ThiF family protein [unclassified Methylocaldum]|jgi:PRTRC genetic system ThiF family protein|uniref:PRTRC system ThiF family protein n=2 Tax=Methylocaldum TaxID=73778 RepID=UPI001AE9B82F|nr:PRTRC system ThiF family protein [Methylocaldum sp. RMAD-M]MBP1152655.1 PRTRC genetic system ThiF family protein [Methylocaldum sp. RMAD-M]